jgi:ABC-2 type transport system ATP-binding protein
VRVAASKRFAQAVASAGGTAVVETDGSMTISGMVAQVIGDLALSLGIAVYELTTLASLEDAFMELTGSSVEYRGSA